MCLRTETHRVPGGHPTTRNHTHGPSQNSRGSRLASTDHSNRCPVVFGIHRILPIFHPKLLQNRETPATTNKERHGLGMGRRSETSLRTPQNSNVPTPSVSPTQLQQIVRCSYRRISLWRGRHTLTRGRNTPECKNLKTTAPPHSLLLGHIHPSRKKLRHLRTRIVGRS